MSEDWPGLAITVSREKRTNRCLQLSSITAAPNLLRLEAHPFRHLLWNTRQELWHHAPMPSNGHVSLGSLIILLASTTVRPSYAAGPWVDRSITLPRHDWAFDVGLGIGHLDVPSSPTGVGLNLEGAVGVTRRLEIGVRTGIRFGNDGRVTRADEYGRLFDRQTFGTNNSNVANPEFRIRGAVLEGEVVELGLEGRAALPFEDNSRFGMQFGLPLAFHLGNSVRLDTGAYVPVVLYDPTLYAISVPLDVWIQATTRLWLGPMTGVRLQQGAFERTDWSLGFGLGYSITRALDLKAMMLMPGINHTEGARNFGAGVGIQVRIE